MKNELRQLGLIWDRVKTKYESGYILYERGLQAALYMELSKEFPDWGIVVEPHWESNIPDMVIVRSNEITDIFELKFVPTWYPEFRADIQKLLAYEGLQHVMLNPVTGHWVDTLPIRADCQSHFVVVGNHESEAVWPKYINDQILLWYGRIGEQNIQWGICRGEAIE